MQRLEVSCALRHIYRYIYIYIYIHYLSDYHAILEEACSCMVGGCLHRLYKNHKGEALFYPSKLLNLQRKRCALPF
jgi:hypothetical protein